jgi:UDP-glucose:(heptosyl)LPS alpha-1,3-glucosyltransferase
MKIALVIEYFDPSSGGAGQWTIAFAKHLLEHGHTVSVVSFLEGHHGLPVQTTVLPHSRFPLTRARRISKCIVELKPDVVYDAGVGASGHVFHPHAGSLLLSHNVLVAKYPKLRRLRTKISPRGWYFRWSMARLEHQQAVHADRIVAVSRRVGKLLAGRHGLSADRICVVPNGVDTDRFDPTRLAELREPTRRALQVGGETLFVIVAHNMLLKGVDTAIRAIAALVNERAAARLVVAGCDPDNFWTGLALKHGVASHVHFVKYVADIAPIYAAADALVHPTRWDACSLATLEGLAAGLPVVTTSMNGAAELITHGWDGLVFSDPEDMVALASHMRALLDPRARKRIGTRARETALRLNARDNFLAVEKILREAAARNAQQSYQ